MKRFFICAMMLLLLCACQKSEQQLLEELGYNDEDITLISNLSEENRARFIEEKNDELLSYLYLDGFKEDKLDEYLQYDKMFEKQFIVDKVNSGLLNKDNASKLKELYENEYFIKNKESLYLKYLDEYASVRDVIERVNTKRYIDLYSDIKQSDLSKDYLVLVNKYYQLPSDYEPDDLVAVSEVPGSGYLRKEVYEAYKMLYDDASKEGYGSLTVVSAYRPYSMQEGLYNYYLTVDPKEVVDTYSARPGHSEHQSGLCLDVSIPGYSLDTFYQTDASKWLAENCYKYGFIIRYPDGKDDITGYMGEPWQLRYLGKKVAEDVYKRNITYDEYYACFVENE